MKVVQMLKSYYCTWYKYDEICFKKMYKKFDKKIKNK